MFSLINNLPRFRSVISLSESVISSGQLGKTRQWVRTWSVISLFDLGNERQLSRPGGSTSRRLTSHKKCVVLAVRSREACAARCLESR